MIIDFVNHSDSAYFISNKNQMYSDINNRNKQNKD